MSSSRVTLAALLVLPLALAGCKINTINSFPPKPAHVRVANVVADAPTIAVSVDDANVFPNVVFESATDFVDFDNEETTFTLTLPNATAPLGQAAYALAGEQTYTLVAYGTTAAPGLMLLPDATVQPGSGRSQLRVANAATGVGTLDVYVNPPGTAIEDVVPNLAGLGYNGATTYLNLSPGTYRIRLTGSGTKTVLYDSGDRALSDNTSTDLIAYSLRSGRLVNALLLDVNGAGQRIVANNTLAHARFVHAAPQAGEVNVLVDGTPVFTGVTYGAATNYATIGAGSHSVAFEAAATPGAPIATVTPALAPATDSTIVVTGLAGSTHAIVLSDDNLPPQSGNARFRFVNASVGVGPVDVRVNDSRQIASLAPDTASGYIELAAGTYTLAFTDPATNTVLATLSASATDTQTNSVYLVGTTGGLEARLAQDD